jgi:hypothetical protein
LEVETVENISEETYDISREEISLLDISASVFSQKKDSQNLVSTVSLFSFLVSQ